MEGAVQERKEALQALRALKAKELAGDGAVSKSQMEELLLRYEGSLRREEALRNVLPGGAVRIVPPSASDEGEEEARAVARQLLGRDFDVGVDRRERDGDGRLLPAGAAGILAVLLLGLVGLLALLTAGPMGPASWLENL